MKSKKIIALLLVLALTLVAVGCAPRPTPQPIATPADQNEYNDYNGYEYEYDPSYEYEEYEEKDWGERYGELEFADENVQLTISFDRPLYTHSDIVSMIATITNIGGEAIAFTKGSGSNLVPDALRVELGEFTPLFFPAMMTMDMQTLSLEPGQSKTFELTFAPYMYADTDAMFPPMIGLDRDIEFFQSDEWKRVQAGEIAGSISFSYAVVGGGDLFFAEEDVIVLEGSFTIQLTENGEQTIQPQATPEPESDENGEEE